MRGLSETIKRVANIGYLRDGSINIRLIAIGMLGIVLLAVGSFWDTKAPGGNSEKIPEVKQAPSANQGRSYEEVLEAKLSNLLAQVRGAGSVAVSITLESSSSQEHAKNVVRESKVTQEKDTSGGLRTTTETKESEQILMSKGNGADHPVLIKETKPVVKGILVIADGAHDSQVKANLTRAIESGLGVPSYRITVLPQRK